ncbi:MAG: T9SS type A sorting domain-containing protein, partial [Candidatus Marinimicrobia bacterium]|nr:T9SS type A sorting domain-containing protein [Candidatus Neomarinimicrobiota bacterium]
FFHLESNYPNPFNNTTNFLIQFYDSGDVFITFFDLSGKEIENIVLLNQKRGRRLVSWHPDTISSGVYLYKISMKNKSVFGKCLLLK